MEVDKRVSRVLFALHLCYLTAFILMVTSICTPSWYTTHPLAPTEQTSYGSLGLIEHCSSTEGVCTERKEILKFTDDYWPYRPLKSKDFDRTLLLLVVAMILTVTSLGLTLLLRFNSFYCKRWSKWLLLLISLKPAILGICGVWYLDRHVTSEQFQHSWSSYVAWLSVGVSTLVNIPICYLLRLKPPLTWENVKLEDFVRTDMTENPIQKPYPDHQHLHSCMEHFQYVDIHDVE